MAVQLANAALVPEEFTIEGKGYPVQGRSGSGFPLLVVAGVIYLFVVAPRYHLPGAALAERIEGVLPSSPTTAARSPVSSQTAVAPSSLGTSEGGSAPNSATGSAPAGNSSGQSPSVSYPNTASGASPYPVAFLVADQADYGVAIQAGVPVNAIYYVGSDPYAGRAGSGYNPPTFLPQYTGQVGQPALTVVVGLAGKVTKGSLATIEGVDRQRTLVLLKQYLAANPWTIQPSTGA
jgi:hypothetical protein